METINPKEKIYFLADTAEIISTITNKYQLVDTPEKFIEKLDKEEPFVIPNGVILEVTLKIIKRELSEKEAVLMLQKSLGITEKLAADVVNEIKTQLVPLATNKKPVSSSPPEGPENIDILPKLKSPIGIEEILEKNKKAPENGLGSIVPESKKTERIKKLVLPEDIDTPPQKTTQPRGADNYREPIE